MSKKEQWINAIRDNSSETIASIILSDIERIEKQEQGIKRLKSRLEEYQEYIEINHKEIERLTKIINELEKWVIDKKYEEGTYCIDCNQVLNKLQELKGSDKE